MLLFQFRSHLADEIGNFPVLPNAATQSYAVTTAVLARRISDYIGAVDLTLPNGFQPTQRPYNLSTILDRIIHFKSLGQDIISFDHPGKPDLITLYSDRNQRYADHMYLRLTDYRNAMTKLATDDRLVAWFLFRQTVNLLTKAGQVDAPQTRQAKISRSELMRTSFDYVLNSWNLVVGLTTKREILVPQSSFDCYEISYDDQSLRKYRGLATCRDFVDGYLKHWFWFVYNPELHEIDGVETPCLDLLLDDGSNDGQMRTAAVPFDNLRRLISDVRKQIERPTRDMARISTQ